MSNCYGGGAAALKWGPASREPHFTPQSATSLEEQFEIRIDPLAGATTDVGG